MAKILLTMPTYMVVCILAGLAAVLRGQDVPVKLEAYGG